MAEPLLRPRRGRPPRIDREAILEAASELARARGASSLTMRAIAARVGVDVGALYGHFESKSALLRALSERAAASLDLPEPGAGPWQESCLGTCEALRRELRRHPELGLLDGEWDALAPFNTRATGLLVRALRGAGLAGPKRIQLSQALLYQITAVARLEAGLSRAPEEQARAYHTAVQESLDPELRADWTALARRPPAEAFDDIFRAGIEALLAGVARS